MMDIDIMPITPADTDRVFQFVCEQFYSDEPLRLSLKLGPPERKEDDDVPELLEGNCSFMAISKTEPGVICGVIINEEISKLHKKEKWVNECKQYEGTATGSFYEFLYFTYGEFLKRADTECWNRADAQSALEIAAIGTHKSYRGQNIAGRLLERTEALAREKNHKWLFMECTSAYSAALAKKKGFHSIYTLQYANYRDKIGVPAVKSIEPHIKFKAMAKYLKP